MGISGCHLGLDFLFLFSMASITKPFSDIPLYLLMLDWKSAFYLNGLKKKVMIDQLPPPIGLVKLNFHECSMGNPKQTCNEGVISDYSGTVLRAFSKHAEMRLAIKVELLALLEGLMQAIVLSLSNLILEGDFAAVISWVNNKKRGLGKFDNSMCKIIDIANELGCSFS